MSLFDSETGSLHNTAKHKFHPHGVVSELNNGVTMMNGRVTMGGEEGIIYNPLSMIHQKVFYPTACSLNNS